MNKNCCDMDGMGNQGRFPNQGRTDRQLEDSYKLTFISIVGLAVTTVLILLFS